MKIALVGLGYLGLPLAVAFAEAGQEVVGFDTDPARVDDLNAGHSHIEDVPDSALEPLGARLRATVRAEDLGECGASVMCVPTPLTSSREPDLSHLRAAGETLAGVLAKGQLVVLESTSYPGT